MAKILMFMRDELYVGEKERNDEFREYVKAFVPHIIEGEITFAEYCVNTPYGFDEAFRENPDCEIVFTTENNSLAQSESCIRGYLTFEWRCFNSKKMVPVIVEKKTDDGITIYTTSHYGIRHSV